MFEGIDGVGFRAKMGEIFEFWMVSRDCFVPRNAKEQGREGRL